MPPPLEWEVSHYDSVANQPTEGDYPYLPLLFDSLHKRLSPANIPTGHLLDRGIQYLRTDRYDGSLNDSNDVSYGDVMLLYYTLRNANVDSARALPVPDSSLFRTYY